MAVSRAAGSGMDTARLGLTSVHDPFTSILLAANKTWSASCSHTKRRDRFITTAIFAPSSAMEMHGFGGSGDEETLVLLTGTQMSNDNLHTRVRL